MAKRMKDEVLEFKRDAIVSAAADLFFAQGYSRTSMDDIARQLSVGKPFLYHYFTSKSELLAEVCNRTTAFAAGLAQAAVAGEESPSQRLRYVVRQLCLRVIEGRTYLAVLLREEKHLPPEAAQQLGQNYHSFNRSMTALLKQGIEAGEFEVENFSVVTHAISGMATWIFSWYRPDGALSAEEVAAQMERLVLRMVTPRGGRPPAGERP